MYSAFDPSFAETIFTSLSHSMEGMPNNIFAAPVTSIQVKFVCAFCEHSQELATGEYVALMQEMKQLEGIALDHFKRRVLCADEEALGEMCIFYPEETDTGRFKKLLTSVTLCKKCIFHFVKSEELVLRDQLKYLEKMTGMRKLEDVFQDPWFELKRLAYYRIKGREGEIREKLAVISKVLASSPSCNGNGASSENVEGRASTSSAVANNPSDNRATTSTTAQFVVTTVKFPVVPSLSKKVVTENQSNQPGQMISAVPPCEISAPIECDRGLNQVISVPSSCGASPKQANCVSNDEENVADLNDGNQSFATAMDSEEILGLDCSTPQPEIAKIIQDNDGGAKSTQHHNPITKSPSPSAIPASQDKDEGPESPQNQSPIIRSPLPKSHDNEEGSNADQNSPSISSIPNTTQESQYNEQSLESSNQQSHSIDEGQDKEKMPRSRHSSLTSDRPLRTRHASSESNISVASTKTSVGASGSLSPVVAIRRLSPCKTPLIIKVSSAAPTACTSSKQTGVKKRTSLENLIDSLAKDKDVNKKSNNKSDEGGKSSTSDRSKQVRQSNADSTNEGDTDAFVTPQSQSKRKKRRKINGDKTKSSDLKLVRARSLTPVRPVRLESSDESDFGKRKGNPGKSGTRKGENLGDKASHKTPEPGRNKKRKASPEKDEEKVISKKVFRIGNRYMTDPSSSSDSDEEYAPGGPALSEEESD